MESIRSTGKRFLDIIFLRWIHLEIFLKVLFIWKRAQESRSSTFESLPLGESKSDKWRRTKLWHNSNADICFDHEFYNAGRITAEKWSESKDSKCRCNNSTNSLIPHQPLRGKPDSKHRFQTVLIFHRQLCYGSKKWRWVILRTN